MAAEASVRHAGFEEELTTALKEIRLALRGLMGTVGCDPERPQDVARRLKVSRNLTWKFSKVLTDEDVYEALRHLPGAEGVGILVKAALVQGAPAEAASRMTRAQEELDRAVQFHIGDRATLSLVLDSLVGADSAERLEQSRKMAFRGSSGLWGVQVRTRMTTTILAPAKHDDSKLDMVMMGGLVGFRRLRLGVKWPVLWPRWYQDDGTPMAGPPNEEALDPAYADPKKPRLIGAFCTPVVPRIELAKVPGGHVYELEAGPVGNSGALNIFFGTITRSVFGRYASGTDIVGEIATSVSLPAEWLQFDVFVHEDLDLLTDLEVVARGQVSGGTQGIRAVPIPLGEKPVELSGQPPLITSPLVPRYDELVEMALQRGGWTLRQFRAMRLAVAYPPMHSSIALRFALPERE